MAEAAKETNEVRAKLRAALERSADEWDRIHAKLVADGVVPADSDSGLAAQTRATLRSA